MRCEVKIYRNYFKQEHISSKLTFVTHNTTLCIIKKSIKAVLAKSGALNEIERA